MAFAQRTDNGPGTGSETVDLSTTDRVWDPATQKCPRYLFIEGAGTIKVTCLDGTVDTFTVPVNYTLALAVQKVWKTGTTATVIHAIS